MEVIKPFRLIAGDKLEIREGGGCMSLFGAPFLAAGVFLILVGAGIVPLENEAELPAWAWPVFVLMGLVFFAAGTGLVFGRSRTVIDAGRGSIMRQWGLLVPFKRKDLNLHDYDAVIIRLDAGDSESVDRYRALLRSQHRGDDLTLYSSTEYIESRDRAAYVARFLGIPLKDQSTYHESVIDPARANEPIREHIPSNGLQQDSMTEPAGMQSRIYESGTTIRFTIPGQGFSPVMLLQFFIPAGILTFIVPSVVSFFRHTHTPPLVQIFFLGVLVLMFGVIPLLSCIHMVLSAIKGRTNVTATATGIVIEETTAWRTRTTRIHADDILGIDYGTAANSMEAFRISATRSGNPYAGKDVQAAPPQSWLQALLSGLVKSKGITVKSKKGIFTFGAGLPDEEVIYLYGIVTRALAARAEQ